MAPKRAPRSIARFEKTNDWMSMKADLQMGLAPGEGLQVLLTEEEKKKYGIRNRISVARFVKKYVATHNRPYVVRSFRRDEGDYFLVQPKQQQAEQKTVRSAALVKRMFDRNMSRRC